MSKEDFKEMLRWIGFILLILSISYLADTIDWAALLNKIGIPTVEQ